jgi:hypothetical protein
MTKNRDIATQIGRSIAADNLDSAGSFLTTGSQGVIVYDYTASSSLAAIDSSTLVDGSLHYLSKLNEMYIWDDPDGAFYSITLDSAGVWSSSGASGASGGSTSSLLWRYLVVQDATDTYLDAEPDTDHGFYTSDGGTEILANHSHGALNPGTDDTYAWFTNGTDPLTGSRVTSFAAGSSTSSFFNRTGTGGARVAYDLNVGDFVAIGFATATDITTLTHINIRTFSNGRSGRVPTEAKLQYYTGDVNSTYNASLWSDYATLNKVTGYGTYEWTSITDGSSITGVQG